MWASRCLPLPGAGSELALALAVDGFAAKRASEIGKGGNPIFAVLVTWLLSVGLILRKREPDADRPYRAWGHPFSSIVCLVGWVLVTLFQAYVERETAVYALAMVAVSWPVYWYLSRK